MSSCSHTPPFLFHDDHRRRLLSPRVASGELTAFERGEKTVREMTGRSLEERHHAVDDRDDALGVHALAQELERLRAVTHVDHRLRRDHADTGLGPEHTISHREHSRLDSAAELTRGGFVGENGEGADLARVGRHAKRVSGPKRSEAVARDLPASGRFFG